VLMLRTTSVALCLVCCLAWGSVASAGDACLVVGHRGYPTELPGNTIESCALALQKGADALEIDLCLTRDDRIVLWHDFRHTNVVALARETGLETGMAYRPWVPNLLSEYRTYVHELDLATFRREYGYTKRSSSPLGGAKRAPYEIPTLDEFARWASGRTSTLQRVFLDVKVPAEPAGLAERFGRRARTVLEGTGLTGQIVFMVTSAPVLRKLQTIFAGTAARFSFDQEIVAVKPSADDYSAVAAARAYGCRVASIGRPRIGVGGWQTYLEVLRRDMAECGDIELVTWTLNDPAEVKAVADLGVRAILTDRPEVVRAIVGGGTSRNLVPVQWHPGLVTPPSSSLFGGLEAR